MKASVTYSLFLVIIHYTVCDPCVNERTCLQNINDRIERIYTTIPTTILGQMLERQNSILTRLDLIIDRIENLDIGSEIRKHTRVLRCLQHRSDIILHQSAWGDDSPLCQTTSKRATLDPAVRQDP